jgi:hypothetical protein
LDLHAVLVIAASNIRDGVGLKTLRGELCKTHVSVMGPDLDHFEPNDWQIAAVYTPVGRSLHGLVRLELADSCCSQRVLDALVAAAPDLRMLELDCCPAYDTVYKIQSERRMRCTGLEVLTVRINLDGRKDTEQAVLILALMDMTRLKTCIVTVLGALRGKKFMIAVEAADEGTMRTSVCSANGQLRMSCHFQDISNRDSSQDEALEWSVVVGENLDWITFHFQDGLVHGLMFLLFLVCVCVYSS